MNDKQYQALIDDRIFVGGVADVQRAIEDEKIDVVYDLRAEVAASSSEISKHQPIVDDGEFQDESIRTGVKQIVQDYQDGKKIFFHCNSGRGRAGTMAVATLMELRLADSIEEAEARVKMVRPEVDVKPQFKEALKRIYGA
ncbi:dual specificity protein phosphatase family protein [Paenisporosarcina sp. OV554]|uniref:protein-tyrosine phosphatase family protein n=1 Tax=Paenisporosarcina sp. OV554 TaxID=2135694 RepID=UPI000D3A7B91|nr:dual specificity protein phosphatase family protein [Paenisporosarcina sp. OV554]PUB16689.1 dual specificity protein phosphatase-like protein [Paenisporosarcina sp. OV554]